MVAVNADVFLQLHPFLQYRVMLALLMQVSGKAKPPRSEAIVTLLERLQHGEKAFTLHGVKGTLKKRFWKLSRETA